MGRSSGRTLSGRRANTRSRREPLALPCARPSKALASRGEARGASRRDRALAAAGTRRAAAKMLLAWPTDAYLLISQPQSSSTSARLQLAAMAGLKSTQTYPCGCAFNPHEASQLRCGKTSRGFPKNSTFVALKRHTDVCNLHPRTVGAWADSATTIYQQHLVPTPTNFRGLANSSRPAVVLLRGALGSAHALCERTRLENTKNPPGGGHTTSAQRKLWKELRAAPQGDPTLRRNFDAFEAFADGWRGHAAALPPERAPLVITYEQLQAEGRAARARAGLLAAGGRRHVRGGEDVRQGAATFISAPTSARSCCAQSSSAARRRRRRRRRGSLRRRRLRRCARARRRRRPRRRRRQPPRGRYFLLRWRICVRRVRGAPARPRVDS